MNTIPISQENKLSLTTLQRRDIFILSVAIQPMASDFVGCHLHLCKTIFETKLEEKTLFCVLPFCSGLVMVNFAPFPLSLQICIYVVSNYSLSLCSSGQSNPTFYLQKDGRAYVLRKKPHGPLLPRAHKVGNTPQQAPNTLYCRWTKFLYKVMQPFSVEGV